MSMRAFFDPEAKRRTADAIRAIEAETSAEVVVAVRHAADRHLRVSFAFGLGCAVFVTLVMLVSPRVYDVRTMPLDALVAFALGTALAATLPSLRRPLVPSAWKRAASERAARQAFDALGIAKTRARTGLLVYVAAFERVAVLVPDEGVPVTLMDERYARAEAATKAAVSTMDLEGFLAALAELGPPLAAALPRQHDDENELCDEVA